MGRADGRVQYADRPLSGSEEMRTGHVCDHDHQRTDQRGREVKLAGRAGQSACDQCDEGHKPGDRHRETGQRSPKDQHD